MKKALVVATVGRFFDFEKNDINLMKELGYEVHGATNMMLEEDDDINTFDIIKHQIDFARSPFSRQTIVAYKQLKDLLRKNRFDLIHCHTPVGGILTRLAARKYRKSGTKVIYTAHGFHFYKGAPIQNWMIFYPLEKFFSLFTDVIITINKEDYERANKKFHARKVEYVPGVGVDVDRFDSLNYDCENKRKELGIDKDDILVISVGELISRKNHEVVLRAIAQLSKEEKSKIKYFLIGKGDLQNHLEKICVELNLDNVTFLGFRRDVAEICASADMFVFPSLQEGLPVALMEAMAASLPIVCSDIRGNNDLIINGFNGLLVKTNNEKDFSCGIKKYLNNIEFANKCGTNAKESVLDFSLSRVEKSMKKIYK